MRYSLNQAAFELLDLYRAKITKTDDVDLRELKKWIRLQRSTWLRNEYNKNREIDDACEQDLGVVSMRYISNNFKNLTSGTAVKALFTLSSATVVYYATDEVTTATVSYVLPIGQTLVIGGTLYTIILSTTAGFTINTAYTGTTDFLTLSELQTSLLLSTLPVPTAVELYDRSAFTRIGPVGKTQYNYLPIINLTRIPYLSNGRFTANSIYTFQWNNYLGLSCKGINSNFTDIFTNGLNVVGVFEDITQAARYPEIADLAIDPTTTFSLPAGSNKYFDDDSEAPIHDWMLYYMRQELIKLEGNISYQVTNKEEQQSGKE